MGWALGVVGMSRADFMALTPAELRAAQQARAEADEARERALWERTRWQAATALSPYSKHAPNPKKLLPLPWDAPQTPRRPPVTKEDDRRAMLATIKKLGKT